MRADRGGGKRIISANGADEDAGVIDVWNIDTFDNELRGDLDTHANLIRDYMIASRRQSREHGASDHRMPCPENPNAGEFLSVKEHIMRLMEARTMRAWHYTRMTDAEIDDLRQKGIQNHATPRIFYGCELTPGDRDALLALAQENVAAPSVADIAAAWRRPWLNKRAAREKTLTAFRRLGPTSVRAPLHADADGQFPLPIDTA